MLCRIKKALKLSQFKSNYKMLVYVLIVACIILFLLSFLLIFMSAKNSYNCRFILVASL